MLLIFDWDGTLADTRRHLIVVTNLIRQHFGLDVLPPEKITVSISGGIHTLTQQLAKEIPSVTLSEVAALQAQFSRPHLAAVSLYPGIDSGLAKLAAAGWQIALVSNNPRQYCLNMLEHFCLQPFFQRIIGGDEMTQPKPHPEALQKLMRAFAAVPEETWMIGDSVNDIACARAAGVHSALAAWGIGPAGDLPPEKIFPNLASLNPDFAFEIVAFG